MKRVITDNSSERIEVKTDSERFSIIKSIKGRLPEELCDKKVTILNKVEAIRIYDLLGQFIRETTPRG